VCIGVGRAVAESLLGVLAIEVEGRVFPLEDEMGFDQTLQLLASLLLLLLQEVLQHRSNYYKGAGKGKYRFN
jgi:hypothetical protein